ncbi:hypothetical protein ACFL35_08175 [Candidatus Riflebacteria bacterium]
MFNIYIKIGILCFLCLFYLPLPVISGSSCHGLCGTLLLRKHRPISASIRASLRPNAKKSINYSFSTGQKKTFKVYNFTNNSFDDLEAVYRGGGSNCYIFVPDEYFTSKYFGSRSPTTVINELVNEFQNKILPMERNYIGQEPNPGLDGDPKVFILITDVKDGAGFGGGFVAGFFNSGDQLTNTGANPSNELDIIYMDLTPGEVGENEWYGTLAHEFSHLIHYVQGGGSEVRWLDEGTATLIDYVYTQEMLQPQVKRFVENPNIALVEDSADFWFGQNPFPYYGEVLLFLLHLQNRFGGGTEAGGQAFLRKLVAEDKNGKDGVAAATGVTFEDVFDNWAIANVVNSQTANNGVWGYPEEFDNVSKNDIDLPVATEKKNINITGSLNVSSSVVNWGNKYFEYSGTGDLDLTFTGSNTSAPYRVTMVTFPTTGEPSAKLISLDSSKKGNLSVSGLGSTVSRVIVRVSAAQSMAGDTGNKDYAFTITGQGVATVTDGTLVPLVNPGLRSGITMVAKLSSGFSGSPTVLVVVNGQTTALSMSKVSTSTYQGSFIFPAGFTGTYTSSLSGKSADGKSVSNSFTFIHNFK